VAQALASLDLILLSLLALCVALVDTPVPRVWAIVAAGLLAIQTYSMHAMDEQPVSPGVPRSDALVHSVAEAMALLAVPALTSALLTVVFFHCARAYARARRRLQAAMAKGQAIGSDMPTG
jgi:hypothetical protein